MNYEEFKSKVVNRPLIDVKLLKLEGFYTHSLKVQIRRWCKKEKIIKLRNNLYILKETDRKINPSRLFISNELYKPSYISNEYALSFYGIIPERVTDITSVTPKKTMIFKNKLGRFIYQHIKQNCFTGFIEQKDEAGLSFLISIPEKAVVDFLYLNSDRFKYDFENTLVDSFRFQNLSGLDNKLLLKYCDLFKFYKLKLIVNALIKIKRGKNV